MRKSADKPLVALDAGALLFPKGQTSSGDLEQQQATALGIVQCYNAMKFAAVGIAPQDLAAGVDFLQTIQGKSDFPWLSANLVYRETEKPVFKRSTQFTAGSLVLGIIGLTDEKLSSENLGEKIALLPWQDILESALNELATKVDLVVLLSSYPHSENKKIAETFPQIHLILQAGASTKRLQPILSDNTLITQTELKGKYIGILDISWQPSKKWGTDPEKILSDVKSEEDRIRWQLKRYRSKGEPEVVYKGNQKIMEAYKGLVQNHEEILTKISNLEKEIAENQALGITPSTFQSRFIAMETSLPDDQRIQDIVMATNEIVNAIGKKKIHSQKAKASPAAPHGPTMEDYIGWQSCVECHHKETTAWQKTRHARAYKSLEDKGQQFNFKCVPCHVTGLSLEEPLENYSLPKDLLTVGCESCHGPGKDHQADPEVMMSFEPAAEICLVCHSPDQDDNFDYERDKVRVH